MAKHSWNYGLPESIWNPKQIADELSMPVLNMSEVFKMAVSDYNLNGMTAALKAYTDISTIIPDIAIPAKSIVGLAETLSALPTVELSSVAESVLPLVDTSALEVLKERALGALTSLPEMDWSWVSEAYSEESGSEEGCNDCLIQTDVADIVTPEIEEEMAADITHVLSKPETMHVTSHSKYLQWKERNPGLAALYLEVLLPVLALIVSLISLGVTIWQAQVTKNSNVYEGPTSTSTIVYNITVDQHVTVIGDEPYYYEVEFPDHDTGDLVTGYIYKGNLVYEEGNAVKIQAVWESSNED